MNGVYNPLLDNLQEELLNYKQPITSITDADIKSNGWIVESKKEGDSKYFTNWYKKNNKELGMLRVENRNKHGISWLLKEDGKVTKLIHTLSELENISK